MTDSYLFQSTNDWLKQQLSDTAGNPSLYQLASDAYATMLTAAAQEGGRSSDAVQAAGIFGGLVRKFRAGLLATITKDLVRITDCDTSRLRIRALQVDIFGKGQDSKDLKQYAKKVRNGGGRAAPMPEIPESLKLAAARKYIEHQDDLKIAVQALFSR